MASVSSADVGAGHRQIQVLELTAGFGSEIAAFDSVSFEGIGAWRLALK